MKPEEARRDRRQLRGHSTEEASNDRRGRGPSNRQAERGNRMSSHSKGAALLPTKLDRVEKRSRQDKGTVFNNLGHLIDLGLLRECFDSMDGNKAVGIDGISKVTYGKNLENNLEQLLFKIRRGSYHPQAARIVEIPKVNGEKRPLAISCFEDKIVQEAVKRIVERIYEPLFVDSSHGFRPGRDCHSALAALGRYLESLECGAVLEIDLQKYFNTIPHKPLERMLRAKISDEKFLHLILKLLKAPILNAAGEAERNEIGSPQGSILSPVLSNVYLHHVLDTWFGWINTSQFGGSAGMVRYADDGAFTFRSIPDAERFQKELVERLAKYGIGVNREKTCVLPSGRREAERQERLGLSMPSFTFLGFLHVWGISVNRKTGKRFWRVKRRTCPKRFRKKLIEMKSFIRNHRHEKDLILRVKRATLGYLNYFAVTDNMKRISQFVYTVRRMLFKWLNRRSQKRSFDWETFDRLLKKLAFPTPVILHHPFFNSRPKVCR
jgi:RNA-directed DNA polymerase